MAAQRENVVIVEGNLTRDPEMRFTQNGIAVVNCGIAQSVMRGDVEEPQFFNVTIWKDMAEHFAESFSKGDRVLIVGRLQYRAWEDKETGAKRSALDIVADNVGASIRWANVTIDKVKSTGGGGGTDAIPADVYNDDEPF